MPAGGSERLGLAARVVPTNVQESAVECKLYKKRPFVGAF